MHMIQKSRPTDMAIKKQVYHLVFVRLKNQWGTFIFQSRILVNQTTHYWHVNAFVLENEFAGMRTFIFDYNVTFH